MAITGPRASVTGVFFLNGALFSGWYARIPAIQERLDLSPGELGIALLGAPAGLLLAQPVVGAIAARRGSRPLVAAAGVAPLGLAAFALAMAVGRLAGDPVAERFGSGPTVRVGALVAALGLALAVALPTPGVAIGGFALMGLGLSAVFPLTLRAAGLQGDTPGPALAAVSTFGYVGFLAGPPVIGLVAEATSLRGSFALVCTLCLAAAVLGGRQR